MSDLLSFLISMRGEWASAKMIAKALNYSVHSIRRAADKMASAHLIESTQDKPVHYRAKIEAWHDLLGTDDGFPEWRY